MTINATAVRAVRFPTVCPSGTVLNTVHVEPLAAYDRSPNFAIAPDCADAMDVLLDARANDPVTIRHNGVMVTFTRRLFDGQSYGLALAIADQRARRTGAPDTPVIATGCIESRGRGAIGDIGGFEQKFACALAFAEEQDRPVIFAFPSGNWQAIEAAQRTTWTRAAGVAGLDLLPCAMLGDAAALWRSVNPRSRRRTWLLVGVIAAVTLVVALYTWSYVAFAPLRDCEAAVAALPDENQNMTELAAAARTCDQAATRFPDNGRMQFLVGQLRAVDKSPILAAKAWRRAAELGDPDGMATYGRYLWQERKQELDAVRWLQAAVAKGSATAAEDLGYMNLDRGDRRAAQRWLAKAKTMRAAKE